MQMVTETHGVATELLPHTDAVRSVKFGFRNAKADSEVGHTGCGVPLSLQPRQEYEEPQIR